MSLRKKKTETVPVGGKPPSFGDQPLLRITGEIPKDLVMEFNIRVAQKASRKNIELAHAIKLYLQQNNNIT